MCYARCFCKSSAVRLQTPAKLSFAGIDEDGVAKREWFRCSWSAGAVGGNGVGGREKASRRRTAASFDATAPGLREESYVSEPVTGAGLWLLP